MRMGLREANQKFSKAIQTVKAGEEVVLTERGTPIAVITPLPRVTGEEAALRRMEAAGLLRRATRHRRLRRFKPVPIKGESTTETLRKMRDERW